MHFLKRQYWHLLRCAFVISQLPSATHVYTRLFCTVRLKKPLHLETTKTDPSSSRPKPKFPFTSPSVLVTVLSSFYFVLWEREFFLLKRWSFPHTNINVLIKTRQLKITTRYWITESNKLSGEGCTVQKKKSK